MIAFSFNSYRSPASPLSSPAGVVAVVEPLKPRNAMQAKYIKLLQNPFANPIVVATGPAGTAKTFCANAVGIQALLDGSYQKLVITRPVVSVDEQIGFLPGDLEAKMDPWLRPIYDVFYKYVSHKQVQSMLDKGLIEICPLAMMRGRTFENAYICADEMQNSTVNQMIMLLTRIGKNSKMVINGDPAQHDRGFGQNGLADFVRKIKPLAPRAHVTTQFEMEEDEQPPACEPDKNGIALVEFTEEHVERHPIVRTVLRLYGGACA